VPDRFGNTLEKQANTHTAAEKHREPGQIGVCRFFIIATQLDLTDRAEQ
jgi:hypothetical protein